MEMHRGPTSGPPLAPLEAERRRAPWVAFGSAQEFFEEGDCTSIIIFSWCGNIFVRKTSRGPYYDLGEKRLNDFAAMWRVAKAVASHVVLIGPGTCDMWVLPPSSESAADSCLSSMHHSGIYHFGLNRMWAALEQLPGDTHHAEATKKNARMFGLHLAWIAWLLIDVSSLGRSLRGEGPCRSAGDQLRCEKDMVVTYDEFIEELRKNSSNEASNMENDVAAEAPVASSSSAASPEPPPVSGGSVAVAPPPPIRIEEYRGWNAPVPGDEDAGKRKSEVASARPEKKDTIRDRRAGECRHRSTTGSAKRCGRSCRRRPSGPIAASPD